MAGDTKERILETALELFAQNGYLGTSMNDIAQQLGFTKAALYKHYTSKQEILDRIVEHMNEMDYERAESYEMPETEPDGFAEAYLNTPIQKIRAYSMAQFDHWTKEPFSSNFRKMLTLEQYRDPKLAQLHHDYLAGGPLEYMAAIFRKLTDTDEAAMQLALEFYGPMYLLYSVYDGAQDKDSVAPLLDAQAVHCQGRILLQKGQGDDMKEHEEKKQWVLCPWCGSKTRLQIFRETELKDFPLFCPKCRHESIINAKNFTIETKEARR